MDFKLLLILGALAVSLAQVTTYNFPSFTNATASQFQFNGDSRLNGNDNSLDLTPAEIAKAGSVFLKNSVQLSGPNGFQASFSTRFVFSMRNAGGVGDVDGPGADGIVFTINAISNTAGSVGGGIGYRGIQKSVGIEFDSYYNTEYSDPDGNHIGIDTKGSVVSIATQAYTVGRFNDGNNYYAWVDFDGATQNLQVRINTVDVRPINSFLTQTVDLVTILGTPNVFVGFTAGTGSGYEVHKISSWYFTNQFAPFSVCGNGVVELGEQCDGGSCCTNNCTFASSTTTCRASAGDCDVAETCTGSNASCPADSFQSASTVCRPSAGACDVAETCTGSTASCPSDSFKPAGTVCRGATDSCDIAETCNGTSSSCPADAQSQSASCFCGRQGTQAKAYPDYFCTTNPSQFYMCLYGEYASQSSLMKCGRGTTCGCPAGQECSCNATQSPCVAAGNVQQC